MLKSYTIPYHASYYTEEGGPDVSPVHQGTWPGKGRGACHAGAKWLSAPGWADSPPKLGNACIPGCDVELNQESDLLNTRREQPPSHRPPGGRTERHLRPRDQRQSRPRFPTQLCKSVIHSRPAGVARENHSVGRDRDSAPRHHKPLDLASSMGQGWAYGQYVKRHSVTVLEEFIEKL